jgi:rsbT co-antagonist protein RsbR
MAMTFEERIAVLATVAIPVWIIDYVNQKMVWANEKALRLWGAADLADLQARDFTKPSEAVRIQHLATQAILEAGGAETRLITFYPHGRSAVTARCHISGFELGDGQVAALTQAVDTVVAIDPEQLRGVEAIRRIWAVVTLLDEAGAVLMQNPAGLRAFGPGGSFRAWFVDESVPRAIDEAVRAGRPYRAEVQVHTVGGERWHTVEAHRTVDPVTGQPATLLLQLDVTDTRQIRLTVEQQAQQIQALSVPILDVGHDALAVPLIGTLNEERSHALATRLLPEVAARRASSVILDLTAVDALDAAGVEALMRVTRALQLLGARPILTGIQPPLAELLVQKGIDLGGVLTLRSLQEGLARSRLHAQRHPPLVSGLVIESGSFGVPAHRAGPLASARSPGWALSPRCH